MSETESSTVNGERVTVAVEMTPAMRERIEIEVSGEEADVADWIETVVSQRLAELDKEIARTVTASPGVEITEEVVEYAYLRMQDHHARGKDVSFGEILIDYVTVSPKYAVTGDDADELTTAREVIAAAVNGDVDHDKAAKCALGEVAAHNASGSDPVSDVREQLESVLGAPDDKKQHFAKQALQLLE